MNNNYIRINPAETIPIYKREIFTAGKRFKTRIQYYFSLDTSAAILPLTPLNLRTVFYNDLSFQERLDIYFRNDQELLRYDYFNKIYFLNKVYQISKNKLK